MRTESFGIHLTDVKLQNKLQEILSREIKCKERNEDCSFTDFLEQIIREYVDANG
jgi:hypothetical protein